MIAPSLSIDPIVFSGVRRTSSGGGKFTSLELNGVQYNFPASIGDAGQVLITDGSGNLSWSFLNSLPTPGPTGDFLMSDGSGWITSPLTKDMLDYVFGFTFPSSDGTNGQFLRTNGSGTLSWATITGLPSGSNGNFLKHNGTAWAGANLTKSDVDTAVGFTFPVGNGTNGQVLTTNGSGALSWSTVSGLPSGTSAQYLRHNGTSWVGGSLQKADIQSSLGADVTLSGSGAVSVIFGSTGTGERGLIFRTGDGTASSQTRWGAIYADSTAESGSNAGSDLRIGTAYSDAGALLRTFAFQVIRSSGQINTQGDINHTSGNYTNAAGSLIFGLANAKIRMGSTSLAVQSSGGSDRITFLSNGNLRLEQSQANVGFTRIHTSFTVTAGSTVNYPFGRYLALTATGSGTPGTITFNNPSFPSEISGSQLESIVVIRNESTSTITSANVSFGANWRADAWTDLAAGTTRVGIFWWDAVNSRMRQIGAWKDSTN